MEKRQDRRSHGPIDGLLEKSIGFFRNYKSWTNAQFIIVLLLAVALSMGGNLLVRAVQGSKGTSPGSQTLDSASTSGQSKEDQSGETTARIMANGDLLYHIPIYRTALKEDGTYDFHENFEYVKPWLKQADLVLGDFEGTVNKDHYLAGYPLFNAPGEVMDAIKDAGYQVLDLAHNHILDSQIEGVVSTAEAIEKAGMTPIGVYTHESRDQAPLVIKEVNGIKVALLAYSYGFNGIEQYISQEDYNRYLSDLNEDKMKAEIERAEQEADITVIMPQMGIEYQLEPTEEQKTLYHKMIDWGADIINDVSEGGVTGIVNTPIHEAENMFDIIGQLKVPYILMSVKSNLHDMMISFADEVQQLRNRGVKDIILDPGFGFGKTLQQNYEIYNDMERLGTLQLPLLVGISRKTMIYKLVGGDPTTALNGTTVLNTAALLKGAGILRVHDVQEAVESVKIVSAIQSPSEIQLP